MSHAVYKPGDRIRHERYGEADVLDVSSGTIRVEFSDGAQRTLLLSFAPITRLDGSELTETSGASQEPSMPSPSTLVSTDAAKPTDDAMLLGDLNALSFRPRGAFRDLAKHLGIAPCSLHGWRRDQSIPATRRAAVRAWIDALPPLEAKTATAKPKPRPAPAKKTKTQAASRSRATPQRISDDTNDMRLYTRTYTLDATYQPLPTEALAAILPRLGLTITDAWIPDGTTMRQVRVAVLP